LQEADAGLRFVLRRRLAVGRVLITRQLRASSRRRLRTCKNGATVYAGRLPPTI